MTKDNENTLFQILDRWLQGLPLGFTVKNFADEVKVWTSKGYLDVGVWKHLQNYVTSDVLPSYSEISHMRRASRLSTSESPVGVLVTPSGTLPGPGGKQPQVNWSKYFQISFQVNVQLFNGIYCISVGYKDSILNTKSLVTKMRYSMNFVSICIKSISKAANYNKQKHSYSNIEYLNWSVSG